VERRQGGKTIRATPRSVVRRLSDRLEEDQRHTQLNDRDDAYACLVRRSGLGEARLAELLVRFDLVTATAQP